MSKPQKYKSSAEKGVAVPSTAEDSEYSPYIIPYSRTGSIRNSNGEWFTTATINVPISSKAAPPVYISTRDGSVIPQGPAQDKEQEARKEQKDGKEPQRFYPMSPGVYTKQGPNKKTL
ncbi:uncharacterized protein GGS22DRAFT_174252 [Annulohypoxylon maeteangense]|uniref:uncharacterized protein n=1 Tax=Annulohypoxylon maeteangense TaxID=1927788 RepID=UPI0020089530|nr:uncharacterized protein GGS22DRAFT_174252 [Annulohypoxylon maeteangense]KAI0880802.1 hypothetical protein GGS22DRAFT_174252 [Annulohypoxylon maeteangense]